MNFEDFKYIIVGSGFWGSVIAERIASVLNEHVVILERRNHVGGNSFSKIHKETGIEYHCYGTHVFHTSNKKVWNYIRTFSDFTNYQHKVFIQHKNRIYSMPINLATINDYYGLNLMPSEIKAFLKKEINRSGHVSSPSNLEDKAISLIGKPLYDSFIRGYTFKQWGTDPKKLPPEIFTRLPVRDNYNMNYFNDPYQGLPEYGYAKLFQNILLNKNIHVMLNTDYYNVKHKIPKRCKVIFTGAIDKLFGFKFGKLAWRSLKFDYEIKNVKDYQGTAVINYADIKTPFTRVHEFKHLHPERNYQSPKTIICREYSKTCQDDNEQYYPINDKKNMEMFHLYEKEARKYPDLIIGGRLGSYRYWDMDTTIESALACFHKRILKGKSS